MAIVMINEHCENALEVSRVQNQQPIEALRTSGPDESFGDPIGVSRQLHRRRAVRPKSFASRIPSTPCMAASSN